MVPDYCERFWGAFAAKCAFDLQDCMRQGGIACLSGQSTGCGVGNHWSGNKAVDISPVSLPTLTWLRVHCWLGRGGPTACHLCTSFFLANRCGFIFCVRLDADLQNDHKFGNVMQLNDVHRSGMYFQTV
jgi:hypothetical protein